MDSIDSSQIPVLIGRSQRRRPEGAEEHPPRRLFPGWGSRGRAFNSRLAGQLDRSRDADADRYRICREPALLSASTPHHLPLTRLLEELEEEVYQLAKKKEKEKFDLEKNQLEFEMKCLAQHGIKLPNQPIQPYGLEEDETNDVYFKS